MRIVELLEEQKSTRWLIVINGKPAAHYLTRPEAMKIKQQLTRKLGAGANIEIVEIPGDRYKIA